MTSMMAPSADNNPIRPAPIYLTEIRPILLAEFRDRILTLYRPPLRSHSSFLSMRRTFDLLAELGGIETTADLTTASVARFVLSRHGKENPNTTRTHLRKLSAACSIAKEEGWIGVNPMKVRRGWVRGVTPKSPRIHSREEIARVLDLAAAEIRNAHPGRRWKARRIYALAATVAYTGIRKREALMLRVEDIALKERIIYLKARGEYELKTEAAGQPVPIPEPLAGVLRGWLTHLGTNGFAFPNSTTEGPWTGGPHGATAVDALKALGERAGVPGFTFQSLRHCWATHAEYWGLTEAQIQRVLRHTTPKTQKTYRHAELTNLRGMVTAVDFKGPGQPAATSIADVAQLEPPAHAPKSVAAELPAMDPRMVDYRAIPGFPKHRVGSDGTVWTSHHRCGRPRFGATPSWRQVKVNIQHGLPVVNLRRDGRTCQRSLSALMREVFGPESCGPVE